MGLLHELAFDYPILMVLQVAFTIAMIVDAYRRGVESWWFYIIFFFQLLGALAYFFAVFLPSRGWHDYHILNWERKTPLSELQYRAHTSPTFANELALGQRLVELGRFEEALVPLESARKREPDHAPLCYALARCLYETHKSQDAIQYVRKIVDKEPRWEDYAAWRLLLKIQEDLALDGDVLETGRQLVKISPRMEHKVLLAEQLARVGEHGEARMVLQNAIEEQQFVNAPVRRMNRKWVKQAKRLLDELAP